MRKKVVFLVLAAMIIFGGFAIAAGGNLPGFARVGFPDFTVEDPVQVTDLSYGQPSRVWPGQVLISGSGTFTNVSPVAYGIQLVITQASGEYPWYETYLWKEGGARSYTVNIGPGETAKIYFEVRISHGSPAGKFDHGELIFYRTVPTAPPTLTSSPNPSPGPSPTSTP